MNIFELAGQITLKGQDKVNQQLTKLEQNTQKVQKGMRIAGAAFTAMGVAGLAIIQTTKKINAQLGVTAINLGVTTKEMRDLTLATTNVTFPIDEVVASFDLLARAGVKDTKVLQDTATAFDTLGDATGNTASVVSGIMIDAMKTFGLTAEEVATKGDMMTYMARNSTIGLEDFATMVGYTDQEMVAAGLTIEDMAAAMMYMGDSGIAPGKVMLREWQAAVSRSKKEGISMTEALGMTTEQLEKYKNGLMNSTGTMQEYADAANEQYTIMDKLKQKWSEITLKMSGFLEPLEPILAGMTALGPLMIVLSTSAGTGAVKFALHTAALIAHKVVLLASAIAIKAITAAQWLWNAAMTANPIGIIIMAIGGLIAAGVALWKNWDKVVDFFKRAWINIKIFFLTGVEKVLGALTKFTGWIPWLGDKIKDAHDAIANMIDSEKVKKAASEVKETLEETGEVIEETGEKVNELAGEFEDFISGIEDLVEAEKFAQTEAGELGVSMDDLKDYMVAAGRENELLALSFEDWLELEDDVNKFADRFQLNLEEVAQVSERTTDDMIRDVEDLTRSAQDAARERTRVEIDAIDDRMAAEHIAHQERMDAIQVEYDATIKAIDAELSYALRGYQSQLDAIDQRMRAIDDARRQEQDAERKAELEAGIAKEEDAARRADLEDRLDKLLIESGNELWQKERKLALEARIAEEKDADERRALEKRLTDFLLEVHRERTRLQLEDERETIRERMELAREEAREAKNRAQEEYNYNRNLQERAFFDLISQLEDEKEALNAALQEKLKLYDADLAAFEAMLAQEAGATAAFVAAYNALLAQLQDRTITITTIYKTIHEAPIYEEAPPETIPPYEAPPYEAPPYEAPPETIPQYEAPSYEKWEEHLLEITPGIQSGGIAMRPILARIGEQAPRVPEAVIPLDRLERMMGGKGKVNIFVELDGRVIAQAVGQPLVDEIRLRTGSHI